MLSEERAKHPVLRNMSRFFVASLLKMTCTVVVQKNKLWRTVPQLVASIHINKDGTKSLFVVAEYATASREACGPRFSRSVGLTGLDDQLYGFGQT
jgi:hypothetical protein